MVQLDKLYKDKRDKEDLVNKKYLYQQNVDQMIKKGEKEGIKPEKKWSEKLHKWIDSDTKVMKDEVDKKIKRFEDSDDSDESDSDSDDDVPIGLRMNMKIESKMKPESK